jgi:hypothetical protein
VAAFNDLQAVRGHANLYFRDWDDRALVASIYEKAKPRRRATWYDVETLQETEAGSNTFVGVAGCWVHHPDRRELLRTQRNIPAPAAWPLSLTYKEHARRARRGVDQASLWG